jgi:hypothetical protein
MFRSFSLTLFYLQARIDLDQTRMEQLLAGLTQQDFLEAQNVYERGGYSKSVSTVELETALPYAVPSGKSLIGKNIHFSNVRVKAYADYEEGAKSIQVQYEEAGCYVGGLPQPDTDNCLRPNGTIFDDDNSNGIKYSYSPTDDTFNERTLQGYATSGDKMKRTTSSPFFPDFQKFVNYYGTESYADVWIKAAFDGTKTNFKYGIADFTEYDFVARAEAVLKGTAYMGVWMYVIRELEDAVYDCESGCVREDCNDDQVYSLDKAVAFYTGSLQGSDGSGEGALLYDLAQKRAINFKTCGSYGDSTEGTAKVNIDIFRLFSAMQQRLLGRDCGNARADKDRIVRLMAVPLIQGALRYAYITNTDPQAGTKPESEGATFAAAVLPLVHYCSAQDAYTIYENLKTGQANTCDFAEVKKAFERNYPCMELTGKDIGGLWNSAALDYYPGAAPSGSGETNLGLAIGLPIGLIVGLVLFVFVYTSNGNQKESITDEQPAAEAYE